MVLGEQQMQGTQGDEAGKDVTFMCLAAKSYSHVAGLL
jgi:hypothetical protein